MSDEQSKRLQLTLWDLQKRLGKQALQVGSDLDDEAAIPTGFAALDQVLSQGGIPRGRINELLGIPTSGMTTLAHKIIASAQGEHSAAAYLDLGQTFDPDYAVRCGVSLDRLLLVRPHTVSEALNIARDLLREGKLVLIVLDLLSTNNQTASTRNLGTPLRRLNEPLAKSHAAVLFLLGDQHSGWKALDEYTHTRLLIERQSWLYQNRDVLGYRVQVTVLKDKSNPGEKQVLIDLTFDDTVKGDGA